MCQNLTHFMSKSVTPARLVVQSHDTSTSDMYKFWDNLHIKAGWYPYLCGASAVKKSTSRDFRMFSEVAILSCNSVRGTVRGLRLGNMADITLLSYLHSL